MLRTSERFGALPAYPLAGMKEIRRKIEAAGVDVIDLGTGDAQLDPPPAVVERLRSVAGELAYSRYGFQAGLPDLRDAVAAWMARRFGVRVDPVTEVLPLIGSKEGLAQAPTLAAALFGFSLLGLPASLAAQAQPQAQPRRTIVVDSVLVEGWQRIQPQSIIGLFGVQPGDEIGYRDIQRGLKELLSIGQIRDVKVLALDNPEGVIVLRV